MSQPGPNPYLRTKIMTASPEELRLMLYEGALRFTRQGLEALQARRLEDSYNAIARAEKIVLELSTSLRHDMAPGLYEKLSALYTYIYRKLVDANVSHEAAPLQEVIDLLDYEKQTWEMLMGKLAEARRGRPAVDHADLTAPQQTAISSLSTQG